MSVHRLFVEFKEETMDRMEFTIYFADPFWTGICIRYTDTCIFSARHVFGAEPSNGEILDFYLNQFDSLEFVESQYRESVREEKNISFKKSLHKGVKEQERRGGQALEIFNRGLSLSLTEKRKQYKNKKKQREKEKFSARQIKKKQKKRGY